MEPQQLDNETLLLEVRRRLDMQQLSAEQVRALVPNVFSSTVTTTQKESHMSLMKILYLLGGTIATLGLVFFIAQIWDDIGSVGRVVITLGVGGVLAWYGSHFMRTQPTTKFGDVLHAIAGLLLPGGMLVLLNEFGVESTSLWPAISVFAILTVFYLMLLRLFAQSVLVFYAIGNGSIAFTLLFNELFPRASEQVYLLYAMMLGLIYVYLSYAFRRDWHPFLQILLNVVGGAMFYIAAFMSIFEGELMYFERRSLFWEALFPILAIGGMAGAVYLRRQSLLLVSTLAVISYIIYITAEYFADSVGWPLALVILGFIIIGIGYGSISVGKRYISQG